MWEIPIVSQFWKESCSNLPSWSSQALAISTPFADFSSGLKLGICQMKRQTIFGFIWYVFLPTKWLKLHQTIYLEVQFQSFSWCVSVWFCMYQCRRVEKETDGKNICQAQKTHNSRNAEKLGAHSAVFRYTYVYIYIYIHMCKYSHVKLYSVL